MSVAGVRIGIVLTDQDRAILAFEERWIDHPTGREMAVRREFGWTQARYQQRLAQVIVMPAALAECPQLVYRLRTRLERRLNQRDRALLRRDE